MRLLVFALVAVGLHAQENAIPPAKSQSLINQSFLQKDALKKAVAGLPKQNWVVPPESKVCSIPLLNATPKVQGTMRQITPPPTEFNMPKLVMPAPACK